MKYILKAVIIFGSATNLLFAQSLDEIKKSFYYGTTAKTIEQVETLSKSAKAQDLVNAGNMLYRLGEDEKAKETFAKAETTEPNSTWSLIAQAKKLLDKKDNTGAEKIFAKVIAKSKSKDAAIASAIGESYMTGEGKNYVKAVENLLLSTTIDSKSMFNYIALGEAYIKNSEGGRAMTAFEYAAEKDATSPIPHYKIGDLYIKARNTKLGLEAMNKAYALDNNFPPVLKDLGEYSKRKRDYEKAKEYFTKYMQVAGKNEDVQLKLINILFYSKDYAGANAIVEELRAKDPNNPELLRVLAYGNYEMGKYADGQKQLEDFMTKSSKEKINSDDYEYLAKFNRKSGNNVQAASNFIMASKLDSTKTDLIDSAAVIYYANKDYKMASEMYLLKTSGKDANAQDYFNLGDTYFKMSDYSNADKAFAKVSELRPSVVIGYKMRGRVASEMEKNNISTTGSALPHYQKVIEVASTAPEKNKASLIEAHRYLAAYYFNSGDKTSAKNSVNSILAIDPTDSFASQLLPQL